MTDSPLDDPLYKIQRELAELDALDHFGFDAAAPGSDMTALQIKVGDKMPAFGDPAKAYIMTDEGLKEFPPRPRWDELITLMQGIPPINKEALARAIGADLGGQYPDPPVNQKVNTNASVAPAHTQQAGAWNGLPSRVASQYPSVTGSAAAAGPPPNVFTGSVTIKINEPSEAMIEAGGKAYTEWGFPSFCPKVIASIYKAMVEASLNKSGA